MLDREMIAEFRRDPVSYLDRTFPAAGDAFWLPGRQLCVAEPAVARAVLINGDGLYEEHADFFHTRRGVFGPREAQIHIHARCPSHAGDESLSRRQAQRQSVAEATVRRRNKGSPARSELSARTRQTCATVIRPKTIPVVIR